MTLRKLFASSPLGTVGIFLPGCVYARQIGLSAAQIAQFVAVLFAGALVLQYPTGWLSDQIDPRKLIFGAALAGAPAPGQARSELSGRA